MLKLIYNFVMFNARYERNIGTIGVDGQKKLSVSKVAVIGCGGLGGLIVELLARIGVGEIVIVDGDTFSESNLNRQLLCTEMNLGINKADVAAERVSIINSSVRVTPIREFLNKDNVMNILAGCHVAVDALDNFPSRICLCRAASEAQIKVVHGAIAGWWGQAAVIEPGDTRLADMWEACIEERGIETETGNPSFTPALVASIQAAETVKVLLGKPSLNALLYIDLLDQRFERIGE